MTESSLIEKPNQGQNTSETGEKIFVMPAKYRGGVDYKTHQSEKIFKSETQKSAPLVTPPLLITPVLPQPKKITAISLKKKIPVKLIVAGIIVIALFAAAAILVIGSLEQPPKVDLSRPSEEIATPKPETESEPEVETPLEPESEAITEPISSNPFAPELTPGADADTDGLTNVEELLYGTDLKLPDTDNDGFLDGNEVYHRYNPKGIAPALILDSGLISVFDLPGYSYTIFYPTAWVVRAISGIDEQVVFTAVSGETIQIIISDKVEGQSIIDWFLTQDSQALADDLLELETKESLRGALSPDRLTAYLDAGPRVYIISYSTGTKATVDYLQTFQMMLNSLKLR